MFEAVYSQLRRRKLINIGILSGEAQVIRGERREYVEVFTRRRQAGLRNGLELEGQVSIHDDTLLNTFANPCHRRQATTTQPVAPMRMEPCSLRDGAIITTGYRDGTTLL